MAAPSLKSIWTHVEVASGGLFPNQPIVARHISVVQQVALFVAMTGLFAVGGLVVPANGFSGFDWVNVFSHGSVPAFYPPWGSVVVRSLTWPLLFGITLAAVALATLKRAVHPISLMLALLALPLWWTLFLGQLEGLVTLGLLGLPWLVPLALIKPQVSIFAVGARRSYLAGAAIFLALSLLIWGPWPLRMLATNQYYAEGRYATDISLGWLGGMVALPLLWYSRGDMDMLMLAGVFMTAHLLPYNLLPVVPAIARLRPRAAALIAVFSWLPVAANWLGPGGWWLGWVFIGMAWLFLAIKRYPRARLSQWFGAFR